MEYGARILKQGWCNDVGRCTALCVGYRDLSVRLRPSAIPPRTQMAMLRRIGYICYLRLLCPTVRLLEAKWHKPLACDTPCYPMVYTYSVMYIRSTPSYEYEWICRRILLPLIYCWVNRSIPEKRQSPYLLRIFPLRPSVPLPHQVSPIYPTRFLPEEIHLLIQSDFTNHALATPTCPSGDPGNPS